MRTKYGYAGLAAATLLVIAGCASGNTASAPEGLEAQPPATEPSVQLESADRAASSSEGVAAKDSTPTQAADRYVVRLANLAVVVADPKGSLEQAAMVAKDVGGSVSSTRTGVGDCLPIDGGEVIPELAVQRCDPRGDDDVASVTLRVPVANFDDAVAKLSALGEVVRLTSNSSDVTESVVDVQARIKTQQQSVKRVRALLAKASTIDEIVKIERELTNRQAELEALLARDKDLKSSAAMSTITATFATDEPALAAGDSWMDDVTEAFAAAWTGLVVGLAFLSPLILAGVVIAVVVLLLVRRRRTDKSDDREPAAEVAEDVPAGPLAELDSASESK